MATIQIVPQSRSGLLFMLPLYTSFVLPFCLFPSFPSNITKHSLSLRFQLGSGMMSSCPALCGHSKNILPSASSKRELRLLNSLFTPPQGNLHFSFVQIRVCLWEVKCFHLIVIALDWRLWQSVEEWKPSLLRGIIPCIQSSWMWRAALLSQTVEEWPTPRLFPLGWGGRVGEIAGLSH